MNLIVKGELIIKTESGYSISPRFIELLKRVEQTGSINTAVKEMGMSYSHAWNTLNKINCQLGNPLLITQRGGRGGGLAELTENGIKLIRQYEMLKKDFEQFLNEHLIQLTDK